MNEEGAGDPGQSRRALLRLIDEKYGRFGDRIAVLFAAQFSAFAGQPAQKKAAGVV